MGGIVKQQEPPVANGGGGVWGWEKKVGEGAS